MKFLKFVLIGLMGLILMVVLTYALLPRGYLLVRILEKEGLSIYPEAVKEGLFETRLFRVHLTVKGYKFTLREVKLGWHNLEIPCGPKGYLRVSYLPLKNLKIVFKDFEGRCADRRDFEKISGVLIYRYPKGLFGKLRLLGFRAPTGPTEVSLRFSGQKLTYHLPALHLHRTIPFHFLP